MRLAEGKKKKKKQLSIQKMKVREGNIGIDMGE